MPTAEAIHAAVWAKFDAITNVNTYDGEIVNADGQPSNPPLDDDGRVHAYAILYVSPGRLYASGLDGSQTSRDGTFRVTCAGGDPQRATWCIDKVLTGLLGAVTISGDTYLIRADESTDPGELRIDVDKTPPRHYLPLVLRLHIP